MPEATVLYSVTAVVVLALVIWVAFVLRTVKEPWARSPVPRPAEPVAADVRAASDDAPRIDADSTAKATPLALANEAKARASKPDDANDKTDAEA